MKIARGMLCLLAFSVIIIGCEDRPDFISAHSVDDDPHDTEVYSEWWDVFSINGEALEKTFGDYYEHDNRLFFLYRCVHARSYVLCRRE